MNKTIISAFALAILASAIFSTTALAVTPVPDKVETWDADGGQCAFKCVKAPTTEYCVYEATTKYGHTFTGIMQPKNTRIQYIWQPSITTCKLSTY